MAMADGTHDPQHEFDQERLEAILVERLDSGRAVEMDEANFRRIREQATAHFLAAASAHGSVP